jgi:hypothetical protein
MSSLSESHGHLKKNEDLADLAETSYVIRLRGKEYGPYSAPMLRRVPGFVLQTPTRKINSSTWLPAFQVIDLSAYFSDKGTETTMKQVVAATHVRNVIASPRYEEEEPSGTGKFIKFLIGAILVGCLFVIGAMLFQVQTFSQWHSSPLGPRAQFLSSTKNHPHR